MRKSIPVQFVDGRLAVSPEHARFMLGYEAKPDTAWQKFWQRFRHLNGIRPIAGGSVFPMRAIERAVERAEAV